MTLQTIKNFKLRLTTHARKQAQQKGVALDLVAKTFANPARVYPSGSHIGQFRVCGNGVCLVGIPEGNEFVLITLYEDGVLTPPRPDQLNTPEGRRYAERYKRGWGRG